MRIALTQNAFDGFSDEGGLIEAWGNHRDRWPGGYIYGSTILRQCSPHYLVRNLLNSIPGKVRSGHATSPYQLIAAGGGALESNECLDDRFRILRIHEDSGVATDLGTTGAVRADHGAPAMKCLEDWQSKAFIQGREHHRPGVGIEAS